MTQLRIGTSGWSYDHWQGVLYRAGLPVRERLAHYTAAYDTVELNASFYRWPSTAAFVSWRRRLPAGFQMSVKAPRGLTHGKRLYAPEAWVARMVAGWQELGERRGGYAGSYSDADVCWWADRIGEWRSGGLDVYAYFNNDGAGNAVRNARALRHALG